MFKAIRRLLGRGSRIDYSGVNRNDPCPCGSGKKFKNCHYEKEKFRRREAHFSKLFQNPK